MRILVKTPNREALVSAIIASVGSGLVILAISFTTGGKPRYLRIGEMRAGATRLPLLGIKQGDSWGRVGATFAVIITVVTAAYLWITYGARLAQVTPSALLPALALSLPLGFANAFTEGIVTRWSIAEGFSGNSRLVALAPWVSALVFGF